MIHVKDAKKVAEEKGYTGEYPECYSWGVIRAKLNLLYARMNDYKKVEHLQDCIHDLFDDIMEEI